MRLEALALGVYISALHAQPKHPARRPASAIGHRCYPDCHKAEDASATFGSDPSSPHPDLSPRRRRLPSRRLGAARIRELSHPTLTAP